MQQAPSAPDLWHQRAVQKPKANTAVHRRTRTSSTYSRPASARQTSLSAPSSSRAKASAAPDVGRQGHIGQPEEAQDEQQREHNLHGVLSST